MRIVYYTDCLSPHQLPLANELAKIIGEDQFRFIYYTRDYSAERIRMGWSVHEVPNWSCYRYDCEDQCLAWLHQSDVLISGSRSSELLDIYDQRTKKCLLTIYQSERWFKPWAGFLRMMHPRFFMMSRKLFKLLNQQNGFYYFPYGIHAAHDMARLCGLLNGDLKCLFKSPQIGFHPIPGGSLWLKNGRGCKRYCLDKMRMWGYFVEPSKFDMLQVRKAGEPKSHEIKILWVGRLLNLKRVDTIVRAVCEHANLKRTDDSLPKITLDIYGMGPEESHLKKIGATHGDVVKFYPPVPIAEVRRLMREHDVYVLSSNGYEGWGAVANEALEEHMTLLGTVEAGASITMLPPELTYKSGNWHELLTLLTQKINNKRCGINKWSVSYAARFVVDFISLVGAKYV